MCQKYLGPRCTPHVRARLDRARRRLDAAQTLFDANPADTRNEERLNAATTNLDGRSAEYDATPGGQRTESARDRRAATAGHYDALGAIVDSDFGIWLQLESLHFRSGWKLACGEPLVLGP